MTLHNRLLAATFSIVVTFSLSQAIAQSQSPKTALVSGGDANTSSQPAPKATKPSAQTAVKGGASAAEIADAKSSGKVWVNTDSGVYHKNGRWYGKTKTGKFMTEGEAKAAGYKEAKKS